MTAAPCDLQRLFCQFSCVAIVEINNKTDLNVSVASLERSKHSRVTAVTFSIEEQEVPDEK